MRRDKRGLSRLTMLIVVVLSGIAAVVVIPKFQHKSGNENAARLKTGLRNLWSAEEAYFSAHASYASSLSDLSDVQTSPGVVLSIETVTASGWSAKATHATPASLTCALFTGDVPAVRPARVEGIIGCK